MFKLESNRLKREFKIQNGTFYASKILNKYSDMTFVPDGNGSEFVIVFSDGDSFSSKGLPVIHSSEEGDKLRFVFAENRGCTVTLEYWIHSDENTICKQITIDQSDERVIDFVLLESIGIVNSETHLGVERISGSEVPCEWACLGQPFYVDSLFFGSEFPGTDNRIIYGTGRIKYYVGRNVGSGYVCPITVMGAGKDNSIAQMKKAFSEYLSTVCRKSRPFFTYNGWFDRLDKITPEGVKATFTAVADKAKQYDLPIESYVLDDGWQSSKADFWCENKYFAGKLSELSQLCESEGSHLGLWLSPRGGYNSKNIHKFSKRLEKAGNGYLSATNTTCTELCCASKKYTEKLADFIIDAANAYKLSCLKLDGFAKEPCVDERHDHLTGGKYSMYYVTEQWNNWVKAFKRIREDEAGNKLWINMTSYANPSPWWLQWVDSIWLQNSADIAFAENEPHQSKVEAEITYRDARYFDQFVNRTTQLPMSAVYNHEPIYANAADTDYTDEAFEKYLLWNAARGAAFNELYLSPDKLSEAKWLSLKKCIDFQKENFDILKNATFIGGNPEENNIYGYVSFSEEGQGIIALRNPSGEEASLTLTLNKLLGAPETLEGAELEKIYAKTLEDSDARYSYNDKLDITLHPFEALIIKLK
jgi:hypothetical protein